MTQEIRYKCECMKEEAVLQVRYRVEGEDIRDYMERIVQFAIGLDHSTRSPFCRNETMEYAKMIYSDAADGLFERPKVN